MPSNGQRLKLLVILVVSQIACLAAGLWIHRHFVISAVDKAAEAEAIAELTADVDELLTAAGRGEPGRAGEPVDGEQVRAFLQTQRTPAEAEWILADARWKTLDVLRTPDADSPPWASPGQTLVWMGSAEEADGGADGGADRLAGTLAMPHGRHVAVARRLRGGKGYLVAHYPLQRAKVAVATLAASLPAAGAITWAWTSALLVIIVYMVVARFDDELSKRRAAADAATLRRIQSLVRTRDAVIFGLAKLAESRDETTGHHLERIAAFASRLAATLRRHPKYRDVVTPEFIQLIGISSALHDVGKVGIEDAILLKPGPLTETERARMQEHSAIGGTCLLEIERRLGTSNFLQMAREIAVSHHERWDGEGYPDGLIGKEIPLSARIVAIADVYDALSTRRPYKKSFPHEECARIIREGSGTQFDPDLVAVFLSIEGAFCQIARQYANDTADRPVAMPNESISREDWQSDDRVPVETAIEQRWPAATDSPNEK